MFEYLMVFKEMFSKRFFYSSVRDFQVKEGLDWQFVDGIANSSSDNYGRQGNPTQTLDLGDKDSIFVVFPRGGKFKVYVIAICKLNKLYNDIMIGKDWWVIVDYLPLMHKMSE
jgi:hypothetical protein